MRLLCRFLFFVSLFTGMLSAAAIAASKPVALMTDSLAAGWQLRLANHEQEQAVAGDQLSLTKGDVSLNIHTDETKRQILTLTMKDAYRAALMVHGGTPIDVTKLGKRAVLSLDINVDELTKGGISFALKCASFDCERQIGFTLDARALQTKGWTNVRVPLSCFMRDGDDFTQVTQPFGIEGGGTGTVSFANIRLLSQGEPTLTCPDYRTLSVTPSMLNEWWALEWWQPRHQQKLQEAKQAKVDLIFLGDSITQGWEKEGAQVWQQYYASRHALNLGFGGDRTENVIWRLQHGEVDGLNPKALVLLIGTNNTGHRHEDPVTTARGVKKILAELQARLPNTKILIMGIFPRDAKPGTVMRDINMSINRKLAGFADNKKIFFLDIGEKFLDEHGNLPIDIMPDLLHPNAKGYAIWAEAMEPRLKMLLQE